MTISYDGTAYAGWQVQKNAPTVQQTLRDAWSHITQEKVVVHGSGRTDRGVHARGQVAHCDSPTVIPVNKLQRGLNALLPDDIRITKLMKSKADFHAQYQTVGKEYRYFIWNDVIVPPFLVRYRTPVFQRLDLARMQAAADLLVGEHDFASFSANPNRDIKGTERRIDVLKVVRRGKEVEIRVRGNGFLYKMVRSISGFLIQVGLGEMEPDRATEILAQKKRSRIVPTASAQGLFLWQVYY